MAEAKNKLAKKSYRQAIKEHCYSKTEDHKLKMSFDAKEAHREKSKIVMRMRRDLETKEQTALAKNKHREIKRLAMKRKREAETEEENNGRGKKISLRRQDTVRP